MAREAARLLALAPTEQKNRALAAGAAALRSRRAQILAANQGDMKRAAQREISGALLDRLQLNEARVEAMARGLEDIAGLADPIGRKHGAVDTAQWDGDSTSVRAARSDRNHL